MRYRMIAASGLLLTLLASGIAWAGEIERNWEEGPDPGKVKKITLKVQVDADDRVSDWTVSPKKYIKRD